MPESAHIDSASYVPGPEIKLSAVKSSSIVILKKPRDV